MINRIKQFAVLSSMLFSISSFGQSTQAVYLDATKPVEIRIEDALSRMTLEEKVAMCHAQSKFSSSGVPRLGIPEVSCTDGPHGIREEISWDQWSNAGWTNDSCFAFPALTCLAATWNPTMSSLYGKSIGEEARYRNKTVLLGPGVNIYRTPLNGRNFEYMGEDPYLASTMVVPYIQGVQQNGVAACVKHYALNNQETDRDIINVNVSDRALYEIYLPAFKAAVQKGKAWSIMGSYNQYKNQHCCHNEYLLNDILRKEWGFDGVVISDWGGAHNTKEAIYNGLDLEFGSWTNGLTWGESNAYKNYYLAEPFLKLLKSGDVKEEELNAKVRNILRMIFRTTMSANRPFGSFATPEHAAAGLKIAQEGIVLLKNEKNILPVDLSKAKHILIVGENAVKKMTVGGGSSSLKAKYECSPLEGLKSRIGNKASISYIAGYKSPEYIEGKTSTEVVNYAELRADAIKEAAKADLVLFFGGLNKNGNQDCEGGDRTGYALPYEQNELISALTKVNANTVVVLISGNAVAMPWAKDVPAIVEGWYGGSEAGNAITSVLLGEVNPSGKLPITFPVNLKDNGAVALGAYPGDGKNETYKEDIFVGYRWVEKQSIKPLFAFGHGLSYTTFTYKNFSADKKEMTNNETITVSMVLKNTGKVKGSEIVQLYISDKKSSLPRPAKELKDFKKVELNPGEEQKVSFTINKEALQFFDDTKHQWVAEPGKFEVLLGAASDDIKGKIAFDLK